MKISKRNKGFTLVEIMIVVVIIAMLAALAIPSFQTARLNTWETKMDNDAKQLAAAAQIFLSRNADFSGPLDFQVDLETGLVGNTNISVRCEQITPGYASISTFDSDALQGAMAFTIEHNNAHIGTKNYATNGFYLP